MKRAAKVIPPTLAIEGSAVPVYQWVHLDPEVLWVVIRTENEGLRKTLGKWVARLHVRDCRVFSQQEDGQARILEFHGPLRGGMVYNTQRKGTEIEVNFRIHMMVLAKSRQGEPWKEEAA